ncbi:MAG: TPM domain-containing protein [Rikenellaceae bacterium]|jgi:uncharacterized membrane protein|nr:TPM domain-containing protein [Rikenellaceae bacterium]
MKPSALFTPQEETLLIEAIRRAEKATSGEIRIHVENHCSGEVLDRAVAVFDSLGMRETEARNGVLIYVALKDRRSAIIGDRGVNAHVGREFWQAAAEAMNARFAAGHFAEGIETAIGMLAEELRGHFPYQPDDVNELPDEISYGNN